MTPARVIGQIYRVQSLRKRAGPRASPLVPVAAPWRV